MALNFLGLGFTFGAKDAGLSTMQEQISQGFESMFAHIEKIGKASSTVSPENIVPPGSDENVNKMSDAVEGLSDRLNNDLPAASNEAADQFHQDSASMESSSRRIGGGFNFIRDAVEKLNVIARQNKLQTFVQAISLSKLNDIANSVGEIGTQGMNLTTSFEATVVASNKSARQMGANYGYVGKELSKFTGKATGMSIALNIGAEEASTALRGYMEATSEMGAIGIRSASDLAKFSSAFGVNADVLRNSTLRMRKEFQMGDDQINQVIGSWTKMGQITGDVGGALNMMPQVMDQLRRRAAMMGKELDPKELADYAASTAGLAAAFMQAGQSSEQARENALGMSEQMLSSKENFKAMFAGASDDLDQFQQSLGIAFGDIGVSMKAMGQSPGEFIAGLAGMIAEAKKTGKDVGPALDMIRGQLAQTLGPDKAAELVNFFRTGDVAAIQMMKDVTKTPADLGKLAKEGFRTGRTLAESFELAKDSFIASFRSIGRVHARAFVKETSAEFKKFNNSLKELVKKGGPMGMMVEKMSEIHQLGALALIPKTLRPMASVFGEMVSQMTPAITAMGALGFRLKSLANPFFLVAGAAGGLFALFKSNEKTIAKQDKAYQAQLKVHDKLERAFKRANKTGRDREKIQKALMASEAKLSAMRQKHAAEARTKTIQQIENAVAAAVEKIGMFGSILFQKMKEWWPYVEDFMSGLWDSLIYGVDPAKGAKGPAAQWGLKLGESIRKGLIIAATAVKTYFVNWWNNMISIWTDDSKPFLEKVKETVGGSAGLILGAFALAKFTPVFGVIKTLSGLVGGPLVGAVKMFGGTMITALGPVGIVVTALAGLAALLHFFPGHFDEISKKVAEFASKFGYYLAVGAEYALKGIALVLSHLPDIFVKFFILAVKAAIGVLDGIKQYLQEKFPNAFYIIEGLFIALKVVAIGVITTIFAVYTIKLADFMKKWVVSHYQRMKDWIAEGKQAVVSAYETVKGWGKSIGEISGKLWKFFFDAQKGWITVAAKGVWAATTTVATWIGKLAMLAAGMIATAAEFLVQFALMTASGVAAAVPVLVAWAPFIALAAAIAGAVYGIIKAWDSIVGFFEGLWDGVLGAFRGARDTIVGLWDGLKRAAERVLGAIIGFFKDPLGSIKNAWSSLVAWMKSALESLKSAAKSVWSGITGAVSSAWSAAKGLVTGGTSAIVGIMKSKAKEAADKYKDSMVDANKEVRGAFSKTQGRSKSTLDEVARYSLGLSQKTIDAVKKYAADARDELNKLAGESAKIIGAMDKSVGRSMVENWDEQRKLREKQRKGEFTQDDAERMKALKTQREQLRKSLSEELGDNVDAMNTRMSLYNEMTREHQLSEEEQVRISKRAGDDKVRALRAVAGLREGLIEESVKETGHFRDLLNTAGFAVANQWQETHKSITIGMENDFKAAKGFAENGMEGVKAVLDETYGYAIDSVKGAQQAMSGIGAYYTSYVQEASRTALSGMDADTKAQSQDIMNVIIAGANAKLVSLKETAKTAEEFAAGAKVISDEAIAKQQEIVDAADAAREKAKALDPELQRQEISKALDVVKETVTAKYAEVGGEAGAALTDAAVQEARELQSTLVEISDLDVKGFQKNIGIIKEQFVPLLQMLLDINKGVVELAPAIEKNFPKVGRAFLDFQKEAQAYFDDKGTKGLPAMVERAFKKIVGLVPQFKTDLLKPLENLWETITSRTERMFEKLTGHMKNTARTLRSIADMSRMVKGTAPTGEGEAAPVRTAQAKTFRSDISGEENIYRAVHWPDWYTQEYKRTSEAMATYLQAIALYMEAEAGGAAQGGRKVATATATPTGGGSYEPMQGPKA